MNEGAPKIGFTQDQIDQKIKEYESLEVHVKKLEIERKKGLDDKEIAELYRALSSLAVEIGDMYMNKKRE
jgi:hypothetical protein